MGNAAAPEMPKNRSHFQFAAAGGYLPYSFTISSGALPAEQAAASKTKLEQEALLYRARRDIAAERAERDRPGFGIAEPPQV